MNIHKNDQVKVITGNARGKTGKVLKVFRENERVIVEGVNIIKRHTKPNAKNPQGGVVQKEAPINV
ncbi:MAG: 50S ribosomal protein L24, partial [Ignavibacteriae bacterium]|nr:50S ribosomal protein L24 [Ignavibacteriota bacterium]